MENLMKQMRGRFSGAGEGRTGESSRIRNQRIPQQKTQSFRGDKKSQNWFRKPFFGKAISRDDDSDNNIEQAVAVAVAAATYAINSIAEPSVQDQKKTGTGLEPGTISERLSGEGSTKGSGSEKCKGPVTDGMDEKETKPAPSFKKFLTLADHLGSTSIAKPGSSPKPDQTETAALKPDLPTEKPEMAEPKPDLSTLKPASTAPKPGTTARRPEEPRTIKRVASDIEAKRQRAARPETKQAKAEAWEKDEMAKIKERYVKLNSTILAWEEKRTKKAKNKLDKAESEMEKKRARALTKFKNEMEDIKRAADGAKAKAAERQRTDELKAKGKANIIRKTGKVPSTCCWSCIVN